MPRRGVRTSPTNDVITAPNAPARTTATARSMTLPRMTKSRNPLSIVQCASLLGAHRRLLDHGRLDCRVPPAEHELADLADNKDHGRDDEAQAPLLGGELIGVQ